MAESVDLKFRGARVLCFDDGGIRCLSSLAILCQLMEKTRKRLDLHIAPEPWQQFDLICGTGFGGLLALMLGRLRMSIAQCRKWLIDFFQSIFEPRQTWMKQWITPTAGERSTIIGDALRFLISDYSSEGYEKCNLESFESNKTCVLCMYATNMRMPARLRSYSSRLDAASTDITVWEAAMATMASPGEFNEIKVGPTNVPYISAGLGFSNPAKEALDEADRIWQVSNIGCLVSIGTGVMPPARMESRWESMNFLNFLSLDNIARIPDLLTTSFRAAVDCERVHEELLRDARLLGIRYFRFNVEDGLQDVGRHEISKIAMITTATAIYLDKHRVDDSLIFCASHILRGPPVPMRQIFHVSYGQGGDEPRLQRQEHAMVPKKISPPRQRQSGCSENPALGEWNTSSLFDTTYTDADSESSYASRAADDWFRRLKALVHTVLERRPHKDNEKIRVAVLDTGVDASHPLFCEHVFNDRNCRDWTGSSGSTYDRIGHGTHTAGLVLKVAPNAALYIGKVFDSVNGNPQTADIVAEAIEHATQVWKVNIITLSFGFARYDNHIRDAIEKAQNQGIITFAASSNEGAIEGQEAAFPARMVGKVIKISAADGKGAASKFNPPLSLSNDNFSILGEAVNSAWPKALHESGEKRGSGTSVATPIAAGTAALVLAFARQLSEPDELTPITNSEMLWSYYGMRAIFVLMSRSSPKDGFNWIRPWALFSNGSATEPTEEISRQVSYELNRL